MPPDTLQNLWQKKAHRTGWSGGLFKKLDNQAIAFTFAFRRDTRREA